MHMEEMGVGIIPWKNSTPIVEGSTLHALQLQPLTINHDLIVVLTLQSPECVIRIEVLDSRHPDSSGRKVKIQGIIISDVPTQKGEIPELKTSILPLMGGALIADRKSIGRRLLSRVWPGKHRKH